MSVTYELFFKPVVSNKGLTYIFYLLPEAKRLAISCEYLCNLCVSIICTCQFIVFCV